MSDIEKRKIPERKREPMGSVQACAEGALFLAAANGDAELAKLASRIGYMTVPVGKILNDPEEAIDLAANAVAAARRFHDLGDGSVTP